MQYFAVVSQKLTWPGVTAAVPSCTVAVSVTTLPEATVVTAPPPEVTARVVVVAAFACAEATFHAPHRVRTSARLRRVSLAARLKERMEGRDSMAERTELTTDNMAA